jgi:hypothetical protein
MIESINYLWDGMMVWEAAIFFGAFFWALFSMVTKLLGKLNIDINENICEVCLTFWMTLIITLNPFIASGAALLKWWIEKNDGIKL